MLISGNAQLIAIKRSSYEWPKFCRLKGTQDWDFFGFDFEICIISYVKILRLKKKFDKAIIGGDTIFPLSLRLSGIEFSLVWD